MPPIASSALAMHPLSDSDLFAHLPTPAVLLAAVEEGSGFIVDDVNPAAARLEGRDREAIIGQRIAEVFADLGQPEGIERLVRIHGTGATESIRLSGTRAGEVSRLPDGRLLCIYREVPPADGEPEQTAAEAWGEAEATVSNLLKVATRRRAETSALLKAARAVLQHQTFGKAARSIFDACRKLLGATSGYVALLNDRGDENEVLFLESGGLPCTVNPELPMPIRGLRELAYRKNRAVFHNDFMNSEWIDFMPAGHVVLNNVLFAPLVMEGRTVGLLGLANKPADFTEEDARIATTFGELAAMALRNSRDLEERLAAEAGLRRSKHLLERTINSLDAAVFVIGSEAFRITDCNRAAERIFGYSREEMVGRPTDFLHVDGDALADFQRRLYPAVERDGDFELHEFRMRRRDGTIFPTDHSVVPLQDDAGRRVGWVSVVRDVSGRHQLEDQLRQAQKMEALGTLAGGIAHDFNNILFPVLGYTEMAMDRLPSEGLERGYLQEVLKGINRARDLIGQILTFSRKHRTELRPLQLQPIIKESLKLLRSTLPTTIEIQHRIDLCGPVLADPTQVHQVLINLCTNAFHAMRESGGALTVGLTEIEKPPPPNGENPASPIPAPSEIQRLEAGAPSLVAGEDARDPSSGGTGGALTVGLTEIEKPPPPNGENPASPIPAPSEVQNWVCFSVSDTGIGMDETTRRQIFDPYFTTKPTEEGTGLGLSVVHGIITDCGGRVTVESTLGEGSVFRIYLPRVDRASRSAAGPSAEPLPLGSERILLVDDEPPIVEMLRMMLVGLGYQVTPYAGSSAALAAFREDPSAVDLVITDLTMPEMTGLELARTLTAIRPDLPVILCTGFSEMATDERLREAGIGYLLMKPVVRSQMARAVRESLDRNATPEAPSGRPHP
jgi:PAS domain S-box-containing protein